MKSYPFSSSTYHVGQLGNELVAAGVPMGGEGRIDWNAFPVATAITIYAQDSAVDATVNATVAAHVPQGVSLIDTGLSTATKPQALLGRTFVASDTGQVFKGDGAAWVPALKHVVVASLSDLPAPVANVITLADNHVYLINGTVDIGANRIVVGVKNTIAGADRQNDILTSGTTGVMFTMDNSSVSKVSLIFDNLTLKATAGTLISASGGATPNQATFITTTITATPSGGTFSNIVFSMRTSSISAFSVGGFVFSGANTALTFRDSSATNNVGTVFDCTSATFSAVRIGRNSMTTATGNTFLNATGTVITLAAQVALNIFTGTETSPLIGVNGETASWTFTANSGVTNTKIPVANLVLPGGATNFLREDGTWQPAGGGGSATFTAFAKDLGAARRSGTFDITGLSGLTADKFVLVRQTAAPIASKGDARDELEFDAIQATGYVLDATTIRVHWHAPGVVVGDYNFAYLVSA